MAWWVPKSQTIVPQKDHTAKRKKEATDEFIDRIFIDS